MSSHAFAAICVDGSGMTWTWTNAHFAKDSFGARVKAKAHFGGDSSALRDEMKRRYE